MAAMYQYNQLFNFKMLIYIHLLHMQPKSFSHQMMAKMEERSEEWRLLS